MQEDKNEMKSKTELSREAREERLASENKDGQKAPLKLKKSVNYVATVVVALILVVVLLYSSISFGFAQKYLPAAKVSSHTVTVAEYNFFYNTIASQVNRYAQRMGQQINLNDPAAFSEKKGQTWGEMISEVADKQVQSFVLAYEEAVKNGIKLDEKEQAELDKMIDNYKQKLVANKTTLNEALATNYGKGVTENLFRELLRKQTIAEKYKKEAPKSVKYSDDELEKLYQAKKDEYDVYDFLYASLVVKPEKVEQPKMPERGKETDKEKLKQINEESAKLQKEYRAKLEKAKKAANEKVKTIEKEAKAAIKDQASFVAFVDKYKNIYQSENGMRPVAPYRYKRLKDMITNADFAKFVSDAKRKANDVYTKSKDNTSIINLGLYLGRQRDESATIHATLRMIQKRTIEQQYKTAKKISDKLTDAQAKEAMQAANDALQAYLAENNSLEAMKKTEIKDYKSSFMDMVDFVPSTSPFVAELGEWLETESRKAGDTNIFQDDRLGLYGVTFLERLPKAAWQSTVSYKESKAKIDKDFQALLEKPENKVVHAFANKLVDRAPFLKRVVAKAEANKPQASQAAKQSEQAKRPVTSQVTATTTK
ncbi:peptidylprolyl isomerase [Amygdalobacter nucleatus]|uniref:Uncharacterized protein n=1 Tax=Amygdalobacter nucleatus TaxID=3029274 RepID=A0A133Y739_9FIRM|nr:hypothetical protein [Amygdalobacter nucleatus]KXB39008.1 hypothetical protein HMPREF1872_01330 [Amygdalobacter nucleatus]MDF0485209.1 hypothetical protein [Amygdalobacter nucleatus]